MNKTKIKCVIWDLDNTIWDGKLRNSANIKLKPNIKEIIQHLYENGIIQSIVSKNYNTVGLSVLEKNKLDKYFVFSQINYLPKSILVKKIINFLNISAETVIYIDDDIFELNEVKKEIKNINIYNADNYLKLLEDKRFNFEIKSIEGNKRTEYLKTKEKRIIEEEKYVGLREEFMKNALTTLEILNFQKNFLDRIVELIYRTNKYNNLEKSDFNSEDILKYMYEKNNNIYVFKMSDIYGEYGIIGTLFFKLIDRKMFIDIFSISCRILGRGIAIAIFSSVINKMFMNNQIDKVICSVNYNEKNRESIILLNLLGFELKERKDNIFKFELNNIIDVKNEEYIHIKFRENI